MLGYIPIFLDRITRLMKITILTLFPDFFNGIVGTSMLKRAAEQLVVEFSIVDIRSYATDKHQTTDDRPYGGGPGMVMKVEPIAAALAAHSPAVSTKHKTLLTSAKGRLFTQRVAQEYSQLDSITIICGHYEGVDERVAEHLIDEEVRIGDYVLTGGEPAAAVMLDAVVRLLPGVLGNELSNQNESHSQPGVMGFPQYTRPEEFNGWKVPEVLLQGHAAKIEQWREEQRKTDI
jgi:tRNA (guanine37-N1)-methyltransferase